MLFCFSSRTWPTAVVGWLLWLLTGPHAQAQAPGWQQVLVSGLTGTSHVVETTTDASGSVYIVGYFSGSVSFGTVTLTSAGASDMFVAKWNHGSFDWVQRAGGTAGDIAEAVAVEGSTVYVTGIFASTATFGPTSLVSRGSNDIFVTKLIDSGSRADFVWSQGIGGTGNDLVYALAVSGGNVYLPGLYRGSSVQFGTSALTLPNLSTTAGASDIFVAKLTDAGPSATFAWAQRAGGPGSEEVQDIAVNGTSVYLAGSFFGTTAQFGATTLTNADPSTYTNDMFITKLTDAGSNSSIIWAQRVGGTDADYAHALAVSGNVLYLLGEFQSPAVAFGSTTLLNADATMGTDILVGKLLDAGSSVTFGWAQRAGGPDYEVAFALALQGNSLYLAGYFFGTTVLGTTMLTSVGSADIMVAKLTDAGPSGAFVWAQAAGGTGTPYDEAYCLAISGTSVYVGGDVQPPAAFGSQSVLSAGNQTVGFLASFIDPALATPLPVQLVDFQAVRQNEDEAVLRWVTASEYASAYFAGERSLDGHTYEEVGRVGAAGTSTQSHSYELRDTRRLTGRTYYRLRQVDSDGSISYSPVRLVDGVAGKIMLMPNPTHGATQLAGAAAMTAVQVFNLLGQIVYTTTTDSQGTALLVLPASLPSGVYIVRTAAEVVRLTVE